MNFLREVVDQGRRAAVEVFSGGGIDRENPFSPDVPKDLEGWLPDLFGRFPVVLPWEKPQPVDPAIHKVWIFDNTAFRSPRPDDERPDLEELADPEISQPERIDSKGKRSRPAANEGSAWEAEFIACYFIKNSGRPVSEVAAQIASALNVGQDDIASRKRIEKRVQPFVDQVLPNRTLRISIDGKEEQTLGPSNYSGISKAIYQLHATPTVPGTLESHAVNMPAPFGEPATTVVADETGWGIISDIDDTIKVTMTPSPLGILHSTFVVENPEPVRGMPELYAHIASTLQFPPFFYLSASPYNLYPFLRRFRDEHYPKGTIILRDASWQNLGGLISSVTTNTQEYKVSRMERVHSWFPHRQFICIGDSTQSDPEAYGEIARNFPGWVKAVYIRKVTGIAEMDIKTKNSPDRFEKAFKDLDRNLWHVFDDPSELTARVDELKRTRQ